MNDSRHRFIVRLGFYMVVGCSLAILFAGWWTGSLEALQSVNDRTLAVGRLLGLIAGWSVVLELILISRVPFIEHSFDLQETSDLHRLNGYVLLGAIAGHLAFLLMGYAQPLHISLWSQFLLFNGGGYEDVLWATLGTAIFFIAGGLSVRAVRGRMRYETWYLIHLSIYFGILLTFLHQIKLGGDLITSFWFASYWYALYILSFGLWSWYRVARPFWLMFKHRFQVVSVEKVANDIYAVTIKGRYMRQFAYEPGQYAIWRFLASELWYEAHPFSIASVPGTDMLRLIVKASADLTERIRRLPAGSYVMVDGPRGNFVPSRAVAAPDVVLIAGGIGITPYLSSMQQLLRDGKQVTLLYAARTRNDVVFVNELQNFERQGAVIRLVIDAEGGRITDSTLQHVVRGTTTVYICGPDGMSKGLTKTLRRLGVPAKNIVAERFAF